MIVPLQCLVRLICDCAVFVQLIHLQRDGVTQRGSAGRLQIYCLDQLLREAFVGTGDTIHSVSCNLTILIECYFPFYSFIYRKHGNINFMLL